VSPQDFDFLRKFLRERSGLVLAVEKQYLAESRLLPVARRNGMSSLDELVDRLKNRAPAPLSAQVVEAMTTNETFFFRDKIPFDHFRETIMPALLTARAASRTANSSQGTSTDAVAPAPAAVTRRESARSGGSRGTWKSTLEPRAPASAARRSKKSGAYQNETQRSPSACSWPHS